jgi:hypothetical protein
MALILGVMLARPLGLRAATVRVPADQPTIQAGILAASADDTVLIAPGTYGGDGNVTLRFYDKDLVLRSADGPDATVIDCELAACGFYLHNDAGRARIEGLAVANGAGHGGGYGGAVFCASSSPTFVDCVFRDGDTLNGGGAYLTTATARFVGCRFVGNRSQYSGAAVYSSGSTIVLENCDFVDNDALFEGGGLYCVNQSSVTMTRCTLWNNSGAAIHAQGADLSLSGCTIAGNQGAWGASGLALINASSAVLDRTIIAFGELGRAINCRDGSTADLTCCAIYGHPDGDWVSCVAEQLDLAGNFSSDPRFCDLEGGDLRVAADSPCLPGNHPHGSDCGLVGGRGEGCPAAPVGTTTWGALKALYR